MGKWAIIVNIRLCKVKKIYKDRTVLDIDDLEFEAGKTYAVLGQNGAGKSTLLKIIAGLELRDGGKLIFNGSDVIPREEISYMPQKAYMFNMSVLENIKLGVPDKKEAEKLARKAVGDLGMEAFSNQKAVLLSGGEAQKVAFLRTIIAGKNIILLDEPASAVDITASRDLEEKIKMLNKKKDATVIFTTHNPSQALRIADEAVFLHNGAVIEKGKVEKVLQKPEKKEFIEFLENWRI